MTIIIIFVILFSIILLISKSCNYSFVSDTGKMYKARDQKTADMLHFLQIISIKLSYDIYPEYGKILRLKLQNCSFIEIMNKDPKILGWNYDKGREIGLKMYDEKGSPLPTSDIIHTPFHELAHSMTKEMHHPPGGEWENINDYLQTFTSKYAKIYDLKIYNLS